MTMHVTFLNLLFVTSSIQATIHAGHLFLKKRLPQHQILLIVLLIILAVESYVSFIWDTSLVQVKPYLIYFTPSFVLGLGPTVYLYSQALLKPDFSFHPKQLLHYIPIVIDLASYQAAFGFNPGLAPGITFASLMNALGDMGLVLSVFVYLSLSLRLVCSYKKEVQNKDVASLQMLRGIYIGIGSITTVWAIYLIASQMRMLSPQVCQALYLAIHVALSALLYWLGSKGLFLLKPALSAWSLKAPIAEPLIKKTENLFSVHRNTLISLLENDKVYLDSELDLTALALRINIHPKRLSCILNQELGKGLAQLLSEYRVAEVKQRLSDPKYARQTIISIALDCGFNSKTTFNRVFKQLTGLTAQQYSQIVCKAGEK